MVHPGLVAKYPEASKVDILLLEQHREMMRVSDIKWPFCEIETEGDDMKMLILAYAEEIRNQIAKEDFSRYRFCVRQAHICKIKDEYGAIMKQWLEQAQTSPYIFDNNPPRLPTDTSTQTLGPAIYQIPPP